MERLPETLWRYKHWRCEYQPVLDGTGHVRLYANDTIVFQKDARQGPNAVEIGANFRALVEASERLGPK